MSQCIEKLPCPDCGSSDSLQTYLNVDEALGVEWVTAFCHGACWETKPDPYSGSIPEVHIKTEEEIQQEIADVTSCKIFTPRKHFRQIPTQYYRSWGVRSLLSEFDGKTPYAIGFPYSIYGKLCGWKIRPIRKKDFYGIGNTRDVDPFGLERAFKIGGDTLWFTEGEFDAIALDYCMAIASGKPNKKFPVVSLTHGGGSITKNFELILDRLKKRKIKRLVFVLDDDEVGHQAEQEAKRLWPEAIIIAKPTGAKDANDAVKLGLTKEMGKLALQL